MSRSCRRISFSRRRRFGAAVTSLSAIAGSTARRSRLRPIQRTSVDRPIPRSPASSRCVRPLVCARRTASSSNSLVNRRCCVIEFLIAHRELSTFPKQVHTGTAANEADIAQRAALLHGGEEDGFGDAGCTGADKRPELADRAVSWNITLRRRIIKALPQALRELAEPVERALSQMRAVVEHPFHIVQNRCRHKRLRYRGLEKNTAQLHTLFALANLVIVKQALLARSG